MFIGYICIISHDFIRFVFLFSFGANPCIMKFNDRLAACEREDAQPMETIEAFADETVFRNDENGYTVLVIKAGRSRVSAVGIMPPISIGEKLRITGEWTEHPVYGRQIKVQSLEIEKPTTLSGIEKYLSLIHI